VSLFIDIKAKERKGKTEFYEGGGVLSTRTIGLIED